MAKGQRPLVFLGVGLFNTIADYLFYSLLIFIVLKDEPVAIVGLLSGSAALGMAFLTHSFITWRGRSIKRATVFKFLLFTGFGMWVIRPMLLTIFIALPFIYDIANSISAAVGLSLSLDFIKSTGAFGLMIIIVLVYNYVVYDKFVFSENGRRDHIDQ